MATQLRLDDLLGRRVRDADGRVIGRIFEVRGEQDGDDLVLLEFHLGTHALGARIGFSFLRMLGIHHAPEPMKIPWDQLDLSDPEHPVLRYAVDR